MVYTTYEDCHLGGGLWHCFTHIILSQKHTMIWPFSTHCPVWPPSSCSGFHLRSTSGIGYFASVQTRYGMGHVCDQKEKHMVTIVHTYIYRGSIHPLSFAFLGSVTQLNHRYIGHVFSRVNYKIQFVTWFWVQISVQTQVHTEIASNY